MNKAKERVQGRGEVLVEANLATDLLRALYRLDHLDDLLYFGHNNGVAGTLVRLRHQVAYL